VLVLRGEAGVGKSALLAELIEGAHDMQVLRATGVESESELAFAGVHQIVWPLLDKVDEIPAPQAAGAERRARRGHSRRRRPLPHWSCRAEPICGGRGVLAVLCVVDDAHWLDETSQDALAFAARRLHAEPLALVFAARVGEGRGFVGAGLTELMVGGLDPSAAGALLDARAGAVLSSRVREQLVRSANGNPLALLELPGALSEDELAGRAPLRERFPVTQTIEAVFLRQARELSSEAQTLLLLAAADDTSDAAVVLRAGAALGIDLAELDLVEKARASACRRRAHSFSSSARPFGGLPRVRRSASVGACTKRFSRLSTNATRIAGCGIAPAATLATTTSSPTSWSDRRMPPFTAEVTSPPPRHSSARRRSRPTRRCVPGGSRPRRAQPGSGVRVESANGLIESVSRLASSR
jgi:hypothetical protein